MHNRGLKRTAWPASSMFHVLVHDLHRYAHTHTHNSCSHWELTPHHTGCWILITFTGRWLGKINSKSRTSILVMSVRADTCWHQPRMHCFANVHIHRSEVREISWTNVNPAFARTYLRVRSTHIPTTCLQLWNEENEKRQDKKTKSENKEAAELLQKWINQHSKRQEGRVPTLKTRWNNR